jgi:hypothetical protein
MSEAGIRLESRLAVRAKLESHDRSLPLSILKRRDAKNAEETPAKDLSVFSVLCVFGSYELAWETT